MYKKITTIRFAYLFALAALMVPATGRSQDNTLTDAEKKNGWVLLFDGKTTNGWRFYKNLPNDSWEVVNGELHAKKDGVQHRSDLVTKDSYGSFEIQLDWKV